MNRMKSIVVVLSLVSTGVFVFGQGQVAPERPEKRIVTRTRLVAIFSDLENELFKGLQEKSEERVDALLSEDFQVWTPAPPGDPVPRGDWKQQALAERIKTFSIRQMAARSVTDDAVLVHFVLSETVEQAGKSRVRDYFVVDLWQQSDDKWHLADRYASSLAAALSKPAVVRPSGKN